MEPRPDDPRLAQFPRPLTPRERATITEVLDRGGVPNAEAFRAQLDHAVAVAPCTCPCASIDLEVDASAVPPAPGIADGVLHAEWRHTIPGDPGPEIYWLLVWQRGGYLSNLEIAWLNEPPPEFPPPDVWKA